MIFKQIHFLFVLLNLNNLYIERSGLLDAFGGYGEIYLNIIVAECKKDRSCILWRRRTVLDAMTI